MNNASDTNQDLEVSKAETQNNSKNNGKGFNKGGNVAKSPNFGSKTQAKYITGEIVNNFQSDYDNVNLNYHNLLLQTAVFFPFGKVFNSKDNQGIFSQTILQSALDIATRRSVSYKIKNSWKEHYTYFNLVVDCLSKYYSLKSLISYGDNQNSKNATITSFVANNCDAEVRDKLQQLGRMLQNAYLPPKLQDMIADIYTLRLSGLTGNSTIIGYTSMDFSTYNTSASLSVELGRRISILSDLFTGDSDVATNIGTLVERTNLNWKLKLKEMPSVLRYDSEFMNIFMNSSKCYVNVDTKVAQYFPNREWYFNYTNGPMSANSVICCADGNLEGLLVPFVSTSGSISYLISDKSQKINKIFVPSNGGSIEMLGLPGYYIATVGGTLSNVKNLLPGGQLVTGISEYNRTALVNNVLYDMFEISKIR